MSWENDGSSARAVESLCGDGRAVCPDGGTDGHEEAGIHISMLQWECRSIIMHTQRLLPIPSCTGPVCAAFR